MGPPWQSRPPLPRRNLRPPTRDRHRNRDVAQVFSLGEIIFRKINVAEHAAVTQRVRLALDNNKKSER